MCVFFIVLPIVVTESRCEDGALRLVKSADLSLEGSGLVEVCVNQHWSRVCHETWDRIEAIVVCRELGFPSNGK